MGKTLGIIIVAVVIVAGAILLRGSYSKTPQPTTSEQTNMPMPMPSSSSTNSSPTAGKNEVQIANYAFSPSTLTVKVGDTVTWTNQDSAGHSATSDNGSFDTGVLAQGKSGSFTFTKAGTYTYHCSVHPNMHGTIIVQ